MPVSQLSISQLKRPWYAAVIELMISNPTWSQGQIARHLGKTQSWLSIVVNSDAFRAKLAEYRERVVDPILEAKVEDRLKAVANDACAALLERLSDGASAMSTKDLTRVVEVATKGLGMGSALTPSMGVQNNLYFIPTPQPSANRAAWQQAVVDSQFTTPRHTPASEASPGIDLFPSEASAVTAPEPELIQPLPDPTSEFLRLVGSPPPVVLPRDIPLFP